MTISPASAANPVALAARALRQAVFAASVLADLDLRPANLGLTLTGGAPVWVPWGEVRSALAGHPAASPLARARLADHLTARRWAADLGPGALADRVRLLGLPTGHALHPGPQWTRRRVLGGALDLGLGAVGLDPAHPDRVVALPTAALLGLGLTDVAPLASGDAAAAGAELVAQARARLEVWGALAAERARRDPLGVLRPCGDADVVTLLGSRSLRAGLAGDAGGLATAVVPTRRRGWTRLSPIDPAFGPCAAAATPAGERGFVRPLLITADEVLLVEAGGRAGDLPLRDPLAVDRSPRAVRFR